MEIHQDCERGEARSPLVIPHLNLFPAAVWRRPKKTIPEFPCHLLCSEQSDYIEFLLLASIHVLPCKICCFPTPNQSYSPSISQQEGSVVMVCGLVFVGCLFVCLFFSSWWEGFGGRACDLHSRKPMFFQGALHRYIMIMLPAPPSIINLFILLLVLIGFVHSNSLQTITARADDCFPPALMNNSGCWLIGSSSAPRALLKKWGY